MEIASFCYGIVFSVLFLPCLIVLLISIRRSILDGSTIPDLSKKYILVTGCDTGFGFELVKRLDARGCHVIATCLTEKGKEELTSISSSRVVTLLLDVTKATSLDSAEASVRKILPTPDDLWGVVNNAGILGFTLGIDFETIAHMKEVFDVNLWGTVAVTKCFLPYLKKSKGRLVVVTSAVSRLGMPFLYGYTTSKSAVSTYCDCIRWELSLWGISLHQIQPGFFQTEIYKDEQMIKDKKIICGNVQHHLNETYGEEWSDAGLWYLMTAKKFADTKLDRVVNSMEHALLSTNPKRLYLPGLDMTFVLWWALLLPADITDFLLQIILSRMPTKILLS